MPKRQGQHPDKALSAVGVRALKEPGRYADGNGLYLVVDPSGAKRWVLRTVVQGRRRDIGLGGLSLVTLAEAREQALGYRKLARAGGDPLAAKRKTRRVVPTFAEAAATVFEERADSWKNAKHRAQWLSSLEAYAVPRLGARAVSDITTADLLAVLAPIWLDKPETARRVRQRIETVLDWSKAAGFIEGDNPMAGVVPGLPKQPKKDGHFAAMPYADVPAFCQRLQAAALNASTRLAFLFLILTAARTNEVIAAHKDEIDLDAAIWTVPAARMKAGRPHVVPLSDLACTTAAQALCHDAQSPFLFPGVRPGKPLSNMVFLQALRRLDVPYTAHGFRSAFRDWAAETTGFPHDVCEMALAHTIKNKAEAAYRRGNLLEKRRALMAAWARHVWR